MSNRSKAGVIKDIRESSQRGVGIIAGGSQLRDLKRCYCRMDEDYYKEVSDQEEEVAGVPPIPVLAVAPLNVEVPEFSDNPESPSPGPSPAPSAGPSRAALPPRSPVGGVTSFMGFYTHDDLAELEQWTVDSRATQADPTSRIEEPNASPNLKIFLRYTSGTQWEVKLIRVSGEVLIEQVKAYLSGYNQLTSFNRRQWLRLFPAWTAQEKREHLEVLADAGCFWVV